MKRLLFIFLALCCVITATAQEKIQYTGVVKDELGAPLIGVTIINPATNTGTTTNTKGEFAYSATSGSTLQFSYLGYESVEVKLASRTLLNIFLKMDSKEIDDIVVTGYMSQRRSDISTAVSSVDMEAISKSGASHVLDAMQGQVSGVQIISDDGSPAGNVTFRIRGTSSLTGGTQPLFVIDGVPQPVTDATDDSEGTNPLAGINPDDIQSMEVLKDAAASAIYGAEGSNGVVIITTKSGQAGKARLNLAVRYGLSVIPKNNMEVLSPEEYAIRRYEQSPTNADWQRIVENEEWNDSSKWTDWVDELTQIAERKEVSASISGGSEKLTYMLSLGYQKNEGVFITNVFDRFTTRLNLTHKVNDKLTLTTNLNYYYTIEENPMQSGLYRKAILADPFMLFRGTTDDEEEEEADVNFRNPLINIQGGDVQKFNQQLSGNLRLQYKITKDLSFITSASATTKTYDYYSIMSDMTTTGRYTSGKITVTDTEASNWVYLAQLQYNKTINRDHRISAFVAFEARDNKSDTYSQSATNFNDLDIGEYSIANAGSYSSPTYNYSSNSSLSQIGRVSYDYKRRYMFNASIRRDGTSKFAADHKYAIFPAVSGAWRVDQESWMKPVKQINSLKVRASYGVTGNSQIASYTSLSLLSMGYVAFGDGSQEVSTSLSGIANGDLKWETSQEYNAGFDLSMFKNRLEFTTDVYYKIVSDMLLSTALPTSSGFSSSWKNAGKMENRGIEFAITARPIVKKNFKWTSAFNISFNRNKVLELDGDQYEQYYSSGAGFGNDVLLRVGMSSGIYYGYIEDGVYNTQEELDNTPEDTNKALGRTRIIDTNGDGTIDTNDRVPIANVTPIHTGGWGNTFNYKNLEFYVFMRWSYGGNQINCNLQDMGNPATTYTNCLRDAWYNAWTEDNPENNYRKRSETNDPYSGYLTTRYVEDGSFLKISTLRLSYNLPEKFVSKLGLSSVKLGVTGTNLWTITRYTGFNVEASNGSGTAKKLAPALDNSAYPVAKTILFSLDINL